MAWLLLTVAGLLEIVWAVMLKQSEGFSRLLPNSGSRWPGWPSQASVAVDDRKHMLGRSVFGRVMPLHWELTARAAAGVRVFGAAIALIWVAYAMFVVVGHDSLPALDTLFKTWVFSGLVFAAGVLCLTRARLIRAGAAAWYVLGAGMLSWGLGSAIWSAFIKNLEEPPYPSIADAFYLGFYPAVYVALMLLARPKLRGIGPSVWFDGLIGMCAVGALGSAFVVPHVVADTGGSAAVVFTNLAYPLADLLLIALVVGVFAISAWRPGRLWMLVGTGLILLAVADTIYLLRVAEGTFAEGTVLDAIWPAGMVLLAFAAWHPVGLHAPFRFEGWRVLVVPSLFTFGSLGVLVYGNLADMNVPALVLAAATVLAALVRLALSFREVRLLSESHRQANTDDLTGLANRRYLLERLRETICDAGRADEPATLLIADLDRFKELNDTLGHQAGDLLLKQLGPRVLDVVSARDTLARLGGDEFAILLPGLDAEAALTVVHQIQGALDNPFRVGGLSIQAEASIGVASFPAHAGNVDTLMQRADVAMYQAKQARTGYQIYAPERDEHSRDRLSLMSDLKKALERDELVLHYQPKGVLATGEVTGVEALLRWHHPKRGMVPPLDFLPLVEHTALMRPLTEHVLDSALGQLRQWLDAGLNLTVAVNLSVPNLLDLALPDDVARLLAKWKIGPKRLQLEVTESVIMADPARVIEVLDRLKVLGVGLSLDDFGTGSSSLSYLKRLPVDELKIDKSFVLAMEDSKADAVIVRSTAELGQRLGLKVVAEGVETARSWDLLVAVGCEEAQGYYLQRPQPAGELYEWLTSRGAEASIEESLAVEDATAPLAPKLLLEVPTGAGT